MSKKDVSSIMESTRSQQLEKFGYLNHTCVYNATQLYKNLLENRYRCDVVRGGLNMPSRDTPENENDLAQTGTGHWWVEVYINNEKYTADIYAIGPEFDGDMVLIADTPDSYIPITRNPSHMNSYIS